MPDEHTSPIPQEQENVGDVCEVELFHPERVATARGEMPGDDLIERLSSIFQCVGHPTRIRILHALLSSELCVCDIAQVLGISVSAVSHQLRTLRAQRVVRFRRDGKMAYYSIDDDHVRSLFNLGLEHIRHGD
ncbi:MAG TPA: metalloregulator ArsR/SmtB family transcription factor [Acidobacteriota bacterium]|nr:metalloregulator ArsR/SmtB family transcription factor [Acidobacteriota bacterium]